MGGYLLRAAEAEVHDSTFALLTHRNGVLTVRFKGPGVSEREATVLSSEISNAIRGCNRRLRVLVLDLHAIESMSSIGFGMCIQLRNQANDLRARSVLYGVNPQLASLFRMLKLDRLYTMVHDEHELDRLLAA